VDVSARAAPAPAPTVSKTLGMLLPSQKHPKSDNSSSGYIANQKLILQNNDPANTGDCAAGPPQVML